MHIADNSTATEWRADIEATEARWASHDSIGAPFADDARATFHVVSTVAARIAHDRVILDAVESLIGPDIICWMTELIVKEPHTTKLGPRSRRSTRDSIACLSDASISN